MADQVPTAALGLSALPEDRRRSSLREPALVRDAVARPIASFGGALSAAVAHAKFADVALGRPQGTVRRLVLPEPRRQTTNPPVVGVKPRAGAPRVAFVHYWLVSMRGGERVLEALCEMFPDADIYTHVYNPASVSPVIKSRRVRTTFINNLPGAVRHYQSYLPLMPWALEELDLSAYDIVISMEFGPAKGVITRPDALHVCYCHSPMRYAWDQYHNYRRNRGPVTRMLMGLLLHGLRQWDVTSSARVDHFIANSAFVASRINKYYRRSSNVIFPPVNVKAFAASLEVKDFYLMVGELVPYKRADLAVSAFTKMNKPLVIIGNGPERRRLEKIAGPSIVFRGKVSQDDLRKAYASCRALIFPGTEDFGIVPVEAMASGRPVIAFGQGGALETVIDGKTGLFFYEQSEAALCKCLEEFETAEDEFDSDVIRRHAESFSIETFKSRVFELLRGWDNRLAAPLPT